ncbi:MAG: helix-turn-helix domain-containing protein [Anaerolineae bacterium]
MLQRLLTLVAAGEIVTQQGLADALGVTGALVGQMVGQLTAQGYLAAAATCGDGCDGCGLAAACGAQQHLRLWTLTDKGRRVLRPHSGS